MVKVLLDEKNTMFNDMSKNLEYYEDLRKLVRSMLIDGTIKSKCFKRERSVIQTKLL